MRILLVDDDPTFIEVASRQLTMSAHTVVTAADGMQAWQLVREDTFDLAIVDLGLPVLDGFSLISYIRGHPKSRAMPIIVVTARGDTTAIDKAFQAGATSFLTKPVQWALFGHHVVYVMRLASWERESRNARTKAMAESRIKDTVISRINNNLRGDLQRLIAHVADLEDKVASGANGDSLLQTTGDMVDVMGTLVRRLDDVVHFSRVLSDNLTLEERRHPLSRLLTQVTSRHAASAARRDVSLVLDGDPASVIVDCDASEIGKALSHLIMNAIEHAPPDSRVVVRAVVTDDASLVISVEDDGPGVSPEVLASLLSPYFDGQPVGNGMGLGLSVAKLVCEAHGGVLSFHTAPGRGTTALVQIPADRVSVGSRSAA